MTCPACTSADRNPMHAEVVAGCEGCLARAYASVGGHVESEQLGNMTPKYRAGLETLFGDRWKEGHAQVKAWGAKIDAAWRRTKAKP